METATEYDMLEHRALETRRQHPTCKERSCRSIWSAMDSGRRRCLSEPKPAELGSKTSRPRADPSAEVRAYRWAGLIAALEALEWRSASKVAK